MRSCNCVSFCCAAACSFATCPTCVCLRTFQVGTAFLEICTTTEPWVSSSNTSPISPSSPNLLLLALPCDVSNPLHSTRCILCQWQENWRLRPMLHTEWFRQGSKSVRSVAVPSCPTFPISSSPRCRLFCLALPPCSLFDMVIFKDVKFDAPVSRMIVCVFPICLIGYPDSIVPTELSIQYLHLHRHSWFVPKYCSVEFPASTPTRFSSKPDPLVLLTQRNRLRAQDISSFFEDDRTGEALQIEKPSVAIAS